MTANQLAAMNLALKALQYAKELRNGEGNVGFYQLLEKDAIDALEEIQTSHPITDGEEPFAYWFKDQNREAPSPRSGWFVHCPCDGHLNGQPGIALYTRPQRKPLDEMTMVYLADQHLYDGGKDYGILQFLRYLAVCQND